jgi:hypothetical protein
MSTTMLYVPTIFFIVYLVVEIGTRMIWLHTPHFTNLKTALLVSGTLISLMTLIFAPIYIPYGVDYLLFNTYQFVSWATFVFFAILTFVYIFEWIKDHKAALMFERSYFRRWYEFAEAHARVMVASPVMAFLGLSGLLLLICNFLLMIRIYGW